MATINADDYMNVAMAIGTQQDRSENTRIMRRPMFNESLLTDIYVNDGLGRRIVDLPAEECTREWCRIVGDLDADVVADIEERIKKLKVQQVLTDAIRWKRLFGGALIVLGIKDGGTFEEPLKEDKAQGIEFIRVVNRFDATWFTSDLYNDPADQRFGQVRHWTIENAVTGSMYRVHESRTIMIDGAALPDQERQNNDGWGMSVVQYVYDHLRRLGMSHRHANNLLERAQQPVFKMPRLADYCQTEIGRENALKRMNMVDMARGTTNTIVIDGAEDYTIHSLTFAGVVDIIDRFAEVVSAVTGIPLPKLMGRSPGGLNASGQGDTENWYATVAQWQNEDLRAPLERIYGMLIGQTDRKWQLEFNPLHTVSDKEQADTDKARAEAIDKYVAMGALDPSEVREHLRNTTEYPISDAGVETDPTRIAPDADLATS